MPGEARSEGAGCGDAIGNTRTGDAEPVEQGGGGDAGSAGVEGGGVEGADVGEVSGEGEDGSRGGAGGRPAAANVLKGVEVAGGGAEALQIDVEGLGGDEVGAAGVDEAEAGGTAALLTVPWMLAERASLPRRPASLPKRRRLDSPRGASRHSPWRLSGTWPRGGGAAERAFELNGAGVGDVGVGAGGMGLEAKVPLLRVGQPECEFGVGEGERGLFLARA